MVYVCDRCGRQTPALPYGGDCPTPDCDGRYTACYVCSNCGQWRRPIRAATALVWDCLNECAARGFAEPIRQEMPRL